MMVGCAPVAQGGVGSSKLAVRTEVSRRRHDAARGRRSYDVALIDKPAKELDSDLEANRTVPVESDMSSRFRLLRLDRAPHEAAPFGHDARQISGTRPP